MKRPKKPPKESLWTAAIAYLGNSNQVFSITILKNPEEIIKDIENKGSIKIGILQKS